MAGRTYEMGNTNGQRRFSEEEQEYARDESRGNRPVKEFRAGLVQVAVWRQNVKTKEKDFVAYSVSVSRRYKDKQGEWKSSSSFGVGDLAGLRACLRKAQDWLLFEAKHEEAN